MKKRRTNNIPIPNAELIFRNFSGKGSMYNNEGNRNFCVFIDDDRKADDLAEEGWNIKILKPRDEQEKPRHYLPVAVSFRNIPPKVFVIQSGKKTLLDETTIESLDYADISNCDVIVSPYNWEMNGTTGIKAYLKTMYVTLEEDEFASKYADFEEGFTDISDEEEPF